MTRYLLVKSPNCSDFTDNSECYFLNSNICFVPEDLFHKYYNITATAEYLNEKLNDLREVFRQSISRILTNTSEEKHLECEIPIKSTEIFDLSSSLILKIIEAWQHPTEGYIMFKYEGDQVKEFDDIETDELLQILKGLE